MRSPRTRNQLAILLLVLAAFLAACIDQSLEEGDRDLVLKIGQLQAYGLILPPDFTAYESFNRQRWFDGSIMIEYEFEAPEELGLPYLYSTAEWHPSKSDACMSFSAGNLGASVGGGEIAERNDLFQFGDKSRFGLLVDDGIPYGNYFGMCRDKTVFMVMLGGVYFDDGEMWGELLKTTLDAVGSRE